MESNDNNNIWDNYKNPCEIKDIKPERTVFNEEELEIISQHIMNSGISDLESK